MPKSFAYIALLCIVGLISTATAQSYYYPANSYTAEHRSDLRSLQEESPDPADYEFQIVPSDQYDVAEIEPPSIALSLWDLVPSPITAVITVGKAIISKAFILINLVLSKVIWIALGAGSVIGFCAFTPFCTLIIEKPFTRELRSLTENVPYLDEVEHFFYQAYDKINELYDQN